MVTNKSIDGLSTRAAKKAAATSNTKKKTPSKKIPAVATTKPKKIPKSSVNPTKVTTPKPSKVSRRAKSGNPEDFLAAPTTNMWDSLIDTDSDASELNSSVDLLTEPTEEDIEETASTDEAIIEEDTAPTNEEVTASFLKPIQAFDFDEDEGLTASEDTVEDIKKTARQESSENSDEESLGTSEEPARHQKQKEKSAKKLKKKPSKKRKIISIVALVIVLILIAGVLWLILWGNDLIAKLTGGNGNLLDLFSLNSETYEPLKTDENGRTNILAFGTGGYDMNGEEGGGVHDGAQLTDSIMLISFDQKTGDTAMISLPRDLKGPATCTATGKINEVYWCNGGDGDNTPEEENIAASALMEAVGTILGVDIQYYAHLNWGSIVSIVDTLGGITVTLDEDILDYEFTGAVYYAGTPYTINGAEAVGLARARHGTEGGDFSRGASQQKIIIGIKNKIFEKELSITDLLGLVSILGDNLRTNFSLSEMKTLAHDANILDFDIMRQISLYPDYMTTGMLNDISYVLPKAGVGNYGAIQLFVAKQLSTDPRDYEEPTIAIYNASGTDGLASTEKIKLEAKGYTVNLIDNAPEGEYSEGTTIYTTTSQKPGTFKLLEEDYNFTPLSQEELPATIAPEYDFIIILND